MILWFGGNMILQGELEVGKLTGFLSYVLQVMNSLMMISNVFLLITRSLASAHRVGRGAGRAGGADLSGQRGHQGEGRKHLFPRASPSSITPTPRSTLCPALIWTLPRGRRWAFWAVPARPRRTLVQLIPRLYDATEGQVLVGGRDVREYDLATPAGCRGHCAAKERALLGNGAGEPPLG